MLVKSYSELYLDDVSRNIGTIFEYAIDYGFDPIVFGISLFVQKL